LVVWTRTLHETGDFDYGEPLVDLLLGQVDAFEIDHFEDSPCDALALWYELLRLGLRVPLAGASGKDSNGIALGTLRTYVRLTPGEDVTCSGWIEGLRAGRSFVTNGPLLLFSVNGQAPGSVVQTTASQVHIQARASSLAPFDSLAMVCNGEVLAEAAPTGTPAAATLDIDVPIPSSCWLAARCLGQGLVHHRPANQRVFAHSGPIYVDVPGQPFRANVQVAQRFAREIERMIAWCRTKARCSTVEARARLTAGFIKARASLSSKVE